MIGITEYFERVTGLKATKEQISVLEALVDDKLKNLVLCCGRGFSKSLLCAIAGLYYAEKSIETGIPIKIMIVSGQDALYQYIDTYITEKLKENLIQKGMYQNIPVEGFRLKNGTQVFIKPPTGKVRSNRADILFLDEAADIPQEIINSASMCLTGNSPNRIIMLSTPHREGILTDIIREPHKYNYELLSYSSEVCPWLIESITRAKKTMSKQQFKIEIMAKIPELSELNYFPRTHMSKCVQPVEPCRVYPESTLEAGIDWGYNEPTVLTITEKSGIKRKVIYHNAWRHQPIEILSVELAKILKQYNIKDSGNVVKADMLPKEYKGWIEKHYEGLYIYYINLADHKQSMLEQLRIKIRQHSITIPTKYINLVKQLNSYRSEMTRGDDLVISLALSSYESPLITKKPTAGKVIICNSSDNPSKSWKNW